MLLEITKSTKIFVTHIQIYYNESYILYILNPKLYTTVYGTRVLMKYHSAIARIVLL